MEKTEAEAETEKQQNNVVAKGLSSMVSSLMEDYDSKAEDALRSQLHLSSSLDRLTGELDQLLEDAPAPFIMQYAGKISSVRKRVSSLNSVLKSIHQRLDNMDHMLSQSMLHSGGIRLCYDFLILTFVMGYINLVTSRHWMFLWFFLLMKLDSRVTRGELGVTTSLPLVNSMISQKHAPNFSAKNIFLYPHELDNTSSVSMFAFSLWAVTSFDITCIENKAAPEFSEHQSSGK
ncbi:hypothetical protein TIFTF001_019757 [Ficus carica]|uniref:Biogenesis of lysosome-related organelles complex 1 subunit 7 n=1 Tax=Ficus carica TaxID=3494 RepID=A0AA88ADK8_FICCA|nr:hypothetical protein TIFTF001_019757 [Ficus carica]